MSIEAMKQALEVYCKTLHPLWNTRISRTEAEGFFEAGFKAAIAEAEKQEPVAFDVTLTEEESEFLRDTIGVDDVSPIRLTVGDGHSGYGLYVSNADYQEEGSALIVNTHPQPKREWVGLTDEGMRALVQQAREVPVEVPCPDYNERLLTLANAKLKELNA